MSHVICILLLVIVSLCPAVGEQRLRGAMMGLWPSSDDIIALRTLGANHIRWQLTWEGFPRSAADNASLADYDKWLESALAHLDKMLPICTKIGLRVHIDLHTPPGGRREDLNCRLFEDVKYQDHFVAVWEKLARRYKDNPAVSGFDLLNEPAEGFVFAGCAHWPELALRVARKIRAIDPARTLIYEPAPWASTEAFKDLKPLPLENVIYSVHFYLPLKFTTQGALGVPTGAVYPGVIDGERWDKDALKKALNPVIAFQRKHGVPIYVGEFSAIRWAPGANEWLRDAFDLWEELGWSWTFHAYREWHGWSPEHDYDPTHLERSAKPTDRLNLLQHYFSRNNSK